MAGSDSGDVFDIKRIRRLVELMKAHDLNEIDLRDGEQQIRLRREDETVVTQAAPVIPAAAAPASAAPAPPAPAAEAEDEGLFVISPMVGTFFTAASPDTEDFVKVGDHVGPETTVCIVEAMKVFNEIPAEVSGKIVAVLVQNGDPVEFGQKIFKVAPQ
ncbi:MAG: acetyl-CoA carboxylase biotin carboxyl carrier protein [Planctomycetes bacterium]|nr:acetyl-CoA carboxylase biotin carboxyl carrier protein [Planctomycetota bacterium]